MRAILTRSAVAGSLVLLLAACPGAQPGIGDGGTAADGSATATDDTYFPFRAGAIWRYAGTYSNHISGAQETSETALRVTAVDDASQVATLRSSHASTLATDSGGGGTFYLRKRGTLIEQSADQASWIRVFDTDTTKKGDVSFLFAGAVSRPSSMFGTIKTSVAAGSATTPLGSFTTLHVASGYDSSSYDPYEWGLDAAEDWDSALGLVLSDRSWVDHSMGYGYSISGDNRVVLAGYRIPLAGGTALQAGLVPDETTAPAAPDQPQVVRDSDTQATVSWSDRSLNESGFSVERMAGKVGWVEVGTTDFDATSFVDKAVSASAYSYRVRSRNAAGASAYSAEVLLPCSGAPAAPGAPYLDARNSNGAVPKRVIYVAASLEVSYAPLGAAFQIDLGGGFADVAGEAPPADAVVGSQYFRPLLFFNTGGQVSLDERASSVDFPAGTYQVRARMRNAKCDGPWGRATELTIYQ